MKKHFLLVVLVGAFSSTLFAQSQKSGIGTVVPNSKLEIRGIGTTSVTSSLNVTASDSTSILYVRDDKNVGINITSPSATLHLKASGTTTATSSFKIVNSSSVNLFRVYDSGNIEAGDASGNLIMGYNPGLSNTGAGNTGFGYTALRYIGAGERNTAIGYNALTSNITRSDNTAIGNGALQSTTGDGKNTAVGSAALTANTSGGNNTGVGYNALTGNTTGEGNTALGYYSLYSNTTGTQNTAVGWGAANLNATGNYNTAIGRSALGFITGSSNVAVGFSAGINQTSTSNALFIDNQNRGSAAAELSNSLIYGVFDATPSNQILRFNTGLLGIGTGTVTPTASLHVVGTGTTSATYVAKYSNSSANFFNVRNDKRIIYTDGNEGNGKVLTSDGSGVATWQTPSGGSQWTTTASDIYYNAGLVGIGTGTASPTASLHIVGTGTTSSTYGLKVHNSTGTNNALMVRDDGLIGMGIAAPTAGLHLRGVGTTTATYTFKSQNSSNNPILSIRDDGRIFSELDAIYCVGTTANNAFKGITSIGGNEYLYLGPNSADAGVLVLRNSGALKTQINGSTNSASFFDNGAGLCIGCQNTSVGTYNSMLTLQNVSSEDWMTFRLGASYGMATYGLASTFLNHKSLQSGYGMKFSIYGATDAMVIDASGEVGLGTATPSYQLELSTNSAAKPSSSTWTVPSDERLKKDITQFTDGLNVVRRINTIKYKYNGIAHTPDNDEAIGILAQQMQSIAPYTVKPVKVTLQQSEVASFPGAVTYKKVQIKGENVQIPEGEILGFDAHPLFFVLINAVKQLDAENALLKARIEALENK